MSFMDTVKGRLHYEFEGPAGAPVLVLSNSLGTTCDMWLPQLPTLLEHFQVLRYDTRGHGQSDVSPGPYTMAQLGGDVVALLDGLQIDRADFCGLSMGGMVGQWLARGTPLLQTIQNAPFVDFISARNVTGGGEQGGVPLGKVVRWYQSTNPELGPLRYLSNGNKVPKSDGARACMTIDPQAPHPADLDYAWYHAEAAKIAVAVGCYQYLTPQEQNFIPVKKTKGKPLHAT